MVQPSYSGNEGCISRPHLKVSWSWYSLVECDIIGQWMQPSEDAVPELRHGKYLPNSRSLLRLNTDAASFTGPGQRGLQGLCLCGSGTSWTSANKWDGLIAESVQLRRYSCSRPLFRRKMRGRNAFWDLLGHERSIRCSLQIWEIKAGFVGCISLWNSLVTTSVWHNLPKITAVEKKEEPELRHGKYLTNSHSLSRKRFCIFFAESFLVWL